MEFRSLKVPCLAALCGFLLAGCGGSPSGEQYVPPDLSTMPGGWTAVPVDCKDTPTMNEIGDDPGVREITCAVFEDLDAVSDPEALLEALNSSVLEAMPSVAPENSGCTSSSLLFPLAFQSCSTEFVSRDGSGGLVQLFLHITTSAEGLTVLGDRLGAKDHLEPGDYVGVPVTAWVGVAWGYPVDEAT